ncbi:Sec-independent protein translocase protein TatB [Neomegalonema sp.]|uniref:Sec-independent protein translocase protein TatB n=1 Tax=Neomegalonema sp. TaxID=2039713 RepID=UPI0026085C64|nr:Sec-independent protein translocase protein TatB [Neomegalonema sp.]MDD2869161.1 Sec-independent protein translocase protein TatB [Neomegalonema sp.]
MFEIGWSEMLLCAIVALVVVGPKDLPHMMRAFGRWVAQLRGLAAQFQRSMEEAAREMDNEDLRDAQKSFRDLKSIRNPFDAAMRGVTDAIKAPPKPAPGAGAPRPATPSPATPSPPAPAPPLPSGEGDAAAPPSAAVPAASAAAPASAPSDPSR